MDQSRSHAQDNEAVLRELILRFASPIGREQLPDVQLFVREVPTDLPFSLPLPEGSVLLGSLVRDHQYVEIALDTPLSPEQATTFYRTHLQASGWREFNDTLSRFVPAYHDGALAYFYHQSASVSIRARSGSGGVTTVHMSVEKGNERDYSGGVMAAGLASHPLPLIPRLEAPTGAQMHVAPRVTAANAVTTSAVLVTDLPLSALVAHYGVQLEQAGWARTGEGMNGPVTWSTWTFQDEKEETCLGRFFVFQMPDKPQEHYLCVQVTK